MTTTTTNEALAQLISDAADALVDLIRAAGKEGRTELGKAANDLYAQVLELRHYTATVYECTDCGEAMTANVSRCDACIAAEDEVDRQREIERLNGPDYDFGD